MLSMWSLESPVGHFFIKLRLWTAHIRNHQTRIMYTLRRGVANMTMTKFGVHEENILKYYCC